MLGNSGDIFQGEKNESYEPGNAVISNLPFCVCLKLQVYQTLQICRCSDRQAVYGFVL